MKNPSRSALFMGCAVWLIYVLAFAWFFIAMPRGTISGEQFQVIVSSVQSTVARIGAIGSLVAFIGVGVTIYATYRRDKGGKLIAAWCLNVLGLSLTPFIFTLM